MPAENLQDAIIERASTFFLFPFTWNGDIHLDSRDWKARPLVVPTSKGQIKEHWAIQKNYAQYIYFHDYVRSFLFQFQNDSDDSQWKPSERSVRFYEFRGLKPPAIIELETYDSKKLSAFLNGIYLHIFPGQVAILTFVAGNKIESGDEESDEKNETILGNYKDSQGIIQKGGDLLFFNNMFRRIYPAYFEKKNFDEQIKNNEFPKSIRITDLHGKTLSIFADTKNHSINDTHLKKNASKKYYPNIIPLITKLLNPLFVNRNNLNHQEKGRSFTPILDDRMLVHTYVAFYKEIIPESFNDKKNVGNEEEREAFKKSCNIYFSYLMYVDNPEKDYNYRYEKKFIESIMKDHTYPRWEHFHSKTGFSRYSSAFQYIGHRGPLYRNFLSMYYHMFLLITFYRVKLIKFSSEVASIAENFLDEKVMTFGVQKSFKKGLRNLHKQFIIFMNIHWFQEVSNQDQGIELFQLMRKAFQLDPMFAQVKDEIERADDLLELLHNEEIEKFTQKAGIIGIIIGSLAVVFAYLSLDYAKTAELLGLSPFAKNVFLLIAFILVILIACHDKSSSLVTWLKNKIRNNK